MFKKRKNRGARLENLRDSEQSEDSLADPSDTTDIGKQIAKTAAAQTSHKTGIFQVSTELKKYDHKEVDTLHSYESTRSAQPAEYSGGATATLEIDTERDRDARAILERKIEIQEHTEISEEKVYRGQAAYTNYIKLSKDQISQNKVTGTKGPLRAPTNVRSTCRFDYQPDICKDYKDTGYCGFGDSCKFLHDRSNYKAGWEIEKEWNEEQKKKKKKLERGEPIDESAQPKGKASDKPFACFICRKPFTKPVETQCKHYFCQKCALEHYAKTAKCAICGKQTKGIFNVADLS